MTAFLRTDDGLKVECWSIGDLLPQNQVDPADESKRTVSRMHMDASTVGGITLFSFAPGNTIFAFGATGLHTSALDFSNAP